MLTADPIKSRAGSGLRAAVVTAAALVILRATLPVMYEQIDFDSDQAIVGLMAKHLTELRAFPLFFYGQHYMLGVQAWIAAPWFLVGGPTLAMLRLPLVLINVAVATVMIAAFVRTGMRPWLACIATLPLIVTTPVVSMALVETLGASIEPFAYVLLLWALRERPYAFGAVLCVGSLHREFTVFALPAVLIAEWIDGRRWPAASLAKAAAAAAAVWLAIAALTRTVNNLGPGGGAREIGSLADEGRLVARWLSFSAGPYMARLGSAITRGLPDLLGARTYSLSRYNINSTLDAGSPLAGLALAAAAIIATVRLLWTARRRQHTRPSRIAPFCVFLALIGAQTIAAYGLNGGIDPAAPPILRYLLFALLVPVALFGAYFSVERAATWRASVALLVAAWSVCALADNLRLIREYRVSPPPSEFRALADYLVSHRIRYGRAQYWDCYIVDFLSRERVTVASTGPVRISAYQSRVDRHAAEAVNIVRQPCSGTPVAAWCLQSPLPSVR